MTRREELAARYTAARPRLIAIAYAILGSHADAEDVVAETWLRLQGADDKTEIRDVVGWATVAVGRAALDAYRSARVRRERYVGPWLPEPRVNPDALADPADRVTLDDQVSFAMLVVLESLSPAERTAWVLHDLFELSFPEVARAVGRSPEAVRQLAARARMHLREAAPRIDVDSCAHAGVVESFLTAAAGGDLQALVDVLDPAVTLTTDGGGQVSAARRPVVGADNVARFVLGIAAKNQDEQVRPVTVNGLLGIGMYRADALSGVVSLTVAGGLITRIDYVRAPDKLRNASVPR
jgi:RNA polymerase sigma-70 factor (ECF subfamily)